MKFYKAFLLIFCSLAGFAFSCVEDPHDIVEPIDVDGKEVFDLYVCAVKHGGMGQNKNGTFVRQVSDLSADTEMVSFEGKGIDITQNYTMESITRGKYYYQVPQEATGGFVKFHIVRGSDGEESIVVDAERPFKENTYYPRKYTHAWLDNGATLLVVGTDAEHKIVYWTKLAESNLAVITEGSLDIPVPDGYTSLSTSGLLTMRPTDGKLFYIYYTNPADENARRTTYIAVIDPSTMTVTENNVVPQEVMEETESAAYGELMQTFITYDESGNMYVAGMVTMILTGKATKYGVLRRIKTGETEFDPTWNGFPDPEGRLITVQYVGGNKILAYSRDESLGTKIDSRSYFYTLIDTEFCTRTRVSCGGIPLRYCSGWYSQRTAVSGRYAYIGVTEGEGADEYPMVYIYDIVSDTVTEGVKLSKGFCFDIIRVMSSDED